MKILSIHTTLHDSNFCILEDGKVKIHNELERFTRIKHDGSMNEGFDDRFNQCLSDCGVFDEEFDYISCVYHSNELISTHLNIDKIKGKPKIKYVGHHTSHASSAFYNSNFEDAIIFSIDGGGYEIINQYDENVFSWQAFSNSIFEGKGNTIKPLSFRGDILSVGYLWHLTLERVLDMGTTLSKYGDESGTIMAMASFGDPYKYIEEYRKLLGYYSNDLNTEFLKSEVEKDENNKFHIAASLQKFTEDFIINFVLMNLKLSESKNVCFTGGVSLNCVALGIISKILIDRGYNVFCDQAPNDSGLSLGAAKYVWYNELNNKKTEESQNSYLGKFYSENEIKNSISSFDVLHVKENVGISDIVELIMGSKIISLFNEGSESGKRALGNRSIIADPRFSFMKDFINEKVKHRKSYRPFAPSVLREHVAEWFEFDIDSPYMSFAVLVNEDKRRLVPAILHNDNTARLQTVTKKENGYYYELINEFYKKTGVPMILNTSFNNQEPIVETPTQAINSFLKTNIDYLYFVSEKILISKRLE